MRLPRDAVAWPTLIALGIDILLLLGSLWLFARSTWYPVAWVLEAVALLQIYLIHHEAVHGAVFKRSPWNTALGCALGALVLYPFPARRDSHLAHHRWTGHPEGDPTNRRLAARLRSLCPEQERRLDKLWRSWVPFIAFGERAALWQLTFADIAKHRNMIAAALCMWLPIGLSLSLYGYLGTFLFWYLPGIALLLILEELINLPHHVDAPLVDSMQPMEFWRQDEVTHSCRGVPIWSRWILMNFNLHTAHHYYPSLPWYHLPRADRLSTAASPPPLAPVLDEIRWSVGRRKKDFFALFNGYCKQ